METCVWLPDNFKTKSMQCFYLLQRKHRKQSKIQKKKEKNLNNKPFEIYDIAF